MTNETAERERLAKILLFMPQDTKEQVNAVIEEIMNTRADAILRGEE